MRSPPNLYSHLLLPFDGVERKCVIQGSHVTLVALLTLSIQSKALFGSLLRPIRKIPYRGIPANNDAKAININRADLWLLWVTPK